MPTSRRRTDATAVTTVGRDPFANHGVVNPPVYHASTVLFPTLADWRNARDLDYQGVRYGRTGTPTTFALEQAVAEIEGGGRLTLGKAATITGIDTGFLAQRNVKSGIGGFKSAVARWTGPGCLHQAVSLASDATKRSKTA